MEVLWDLAKALLSGKLIKLNDYLRQEERSQFTNLNYCLKKLGKEQNKPNTCRRKEVIKRKEGRNEIEIRKTIDKNQQNIKLFGKKINKVDKPLESLTKIKEMTHTISIRTEIGVLLQNLQPLKGY